MNGTGGTILLQVYTDIFYLLGGAIKSLYFKLGTMNHNYSNP